MRETKAAKKTRTEQIIKLLKRAHPDAKCALNHSNPFELLIATILSAQCTDERVNKVTADLFRKYRKPEDYLKVRDTELQEDIKTTGFFRNKRNPSRALARCWSTISAAKYRRRWRSC
jgi:endonuclease-3